MGRGSLAVCCGYIPAMRAWILLVITLSFALQGWAAARASNVPCPMDASISMALAQAASGAEGNALDATVGDCCNDMETFLLSGHACKTGQDCQVPLAAMLLPQPEKAAAVARQTVPILRTLAEPSAIPIAVWRPPNSI